MAAEIEQTSTAMEKDIILLAVPASFLHGSKCVGDEISGSFRKREQNAVIKPAERIQLLLEPIVI